MEIRATPPRSQWVKKAKWYVVFMDSGLCLCYINIYTVVDNIDFNPGINWRVKSIKIFTICRGHPAKRALSAMRRALLAGYHWCIVLYYTGLAIIHSIHIVYHNGPGAHFTNDFSITIQIRWKFHLALIQLLMTISQQNLAHATTAQLSCHVPNIVAITLLVFGWEQNEISITFELWWKNC